MTANTANLIDDLVAKVRELAAARPHNVYDSDAGCNYADGECSDGTTGCLLGQALLALGFTVKRLRQLDELTVSSIAIALQTLLDTDQLPTDQVRWLMSVQNAQDLELAWAAAVEVADQEALP